MTGDPTRTDPRLHLDEIRPRGEDPLPETAFSRRVDGWILRLGETLSWVWLALMVVIVLNVLLRYVFGEGRIELEELQWHLYAVGFMTALSLAVTTDDHVRVDLIHERLPLHLRAWIELYGYAPSFAAGTVCAVGTLGILIPPSIMLVLMADRLAMSVGDLFLGALFPGMLLGALYVGWIRSTPASRRTRPPPGAMPSPWTCGWCST